MVCVATVRVKLSRCESPGFRVPFFWGVCVSPSGAGARGVVCGIFFYFPIFVCCAVRGGRVLCACGFFCRCGVLWVCLLGIWGVLCCELLSRCVFVVWCVLSCFSGKCLCFCFTGVLSATATGVVVSCSPALLRALLWGLWAMLSCLLGRVCCFVCYGFFFLRGRASETRGLCLFFLNISLCAHASVGVWCVVCAVLWGFFLWFSCARLFFSAPVYGGGVSIGVLVSRFFLWCVLRCARVVLLWGLCLAESLCDLVFGVDVVCPRV
ncbi:hypothetical protein P800_01141 [Acinetobacter lwoffii NCTC 5866 = CIP 64.10 = NIPH 512]|uniref:Uncharacterized protein n=1 Tax=Acinetobacter lwoffii NCTC 5866 = CIP 64.10 = NIPH 512 TaxID=981327 RepID=A0ABP2ZFM3_ACILW|nr:hypothetical protein P800_01141 [Acinetobacter lwoffii NCTC 5866 = CIP 64.10 = NIPH 512]